jgi:kinesin family member 16B
LDFYFKTNLTNFIFTQRDDIEKYELELIEKDSLLEKCHRKIDEMHEKLKELEMENRKLLMQKSQEELDRIQLKKQSLTLNLKSKTSDVQTDTLGLPENGAQTGGTETCDTFHTANSDCSFASALPSPFPPRNHSEKSSPETPSELRDDAKTAMSDSGVCLESKVPENSQSSSSALQLPINIKQHLYDGDNLSTNSSQNFYEQMVSTQMDKLREKIATRKAEIMRILEMGGEKSLLDEMINELQELQKEYVKLEIRLDNSRGMFFFKNIL